MIQFEDIIKNKEYRERVIKYFKLPIRISVSEEKFLSDLKFIKKVSPEEYEKIKKYTEHDFNKIAKEQKTNEPDFTMEDVLEPLLEKLENSEEWNKFLEEDYSDILKSYNGIKNTHGFYTKENANRRYLNIDLKTANWQSLQNILNENEKYEDSMRKLTDNLIPPISRTFRMKTTKSASKEIMLYNKKLLNDNKYNIIDTINKHLKINLSHEEPFAFYADEFTLEIDEETLKVLQESDLKEMEERITNEVGVNVHITPFTLKWLGLNRACAKVYKENYEIINISKDVLMLINKIIHNVPIEDIDFEKIPLKGESKESYLKNLMNVIEKLK